MAQPPLGQLYSHVYMQRGVPTRDSRRLRVRVAHFFEVNLRGRAVNPCAQALQTELGVDIEYGVNGYQVESFLRDCPLRDFLNALTLIARVAELDRDNRLAPAWLTFLRRALAEENVGYSVDDAGGVHPTVDEEFERNRQASLAVLKHPGLANALDAHETAFRHFEAQEQDTKAAVRSIFEVVEIVAKCLCPNAQRLNRALIDGQLRTVCLPVMARDPTEQQVLGSMFDSLARWVDGLHNYRHGQGQPDPVAPSEQLSVWALSTGSAYARVLAECFARLNP